MYPFVNRLGDGLRGCLGWEGGGLFRLGFVWGFFLLAFCFLITLHNPFIISFFVAVQETSCYFTCGWIKEQKLQPGPVPFLCTNPLMLDYPDGT